MGHRRCFSELRKSLEDKTDQTHDSVKMDHKDSRGPGGESRKENYGKDKEIGNMNKEPFD